MKNHPSQLIYTLRSDYATRSLEEADAKKNPFEQFEIWMGEALSEYAEDANAMTLTTASTDGKSSARIVLLRGFSPKGFVFFTNYDSRKGSDIAENPRASLLFYWARLERQVRVEGAIEKTGRRVSLDYFATRPRDSQIGAWASAQSRVLERGRIELEEKFAALEKKFAGKAVPCPEFWGGYIVKPVEIEFWQGRANRLHDRLRYTKSGRAWRIERLSP